MSDTPKDFIDIWYAAKTTQIVYMPPKVIETFGETKVLYTLISEDMDNPTRLNLRSGQVTAERPRIITPHYYREKTVENWGPDAQRYFDEVMSKNDQARFLQYGLRFMKQDFNCQSVSGNVGDVAEQAARDAQDDLETVRGVVIGNDDTWEVSLMFFITRLVEKSLPYNARDIDARGLFRLDDGVPVAVRNEIEADMAACQTLEDARRLGGKLKDYGLMDSYEDRFYALYRRLKDA